MAGREEAGGLPSSILGIPENAKNMYNIEEKWVSIKFVWMGTLKFIAQKHFGAK